MAAGGQGRHRPAAAADALAGHPVNGGSSSSSAAPSRGYLRSQSLDIPRLEPGNIIARRLALMRCAHPQTLILNSLPLFAHQARQHNRAAARAHAVRILP